MKKCIYLMAVFGCLLLPVAGCGSKKEAVLLESALMQEGTETDAEEKAPGTDTADEAEGADSPDEEASGGTDTLFVFICGAVVNPGVYEVESGSRIVDVLALAGGFAEEAGTEYLNLAETVSDGQKVYVPTEEEVGDALFDSDGASYDAQARDSSLGGQETDASGRININTASKELLVTLPGIGDAKADSIIEYRTANGGFSTIEEIMEIPGIKESVFSKIKDLITVD